MDHNLIKIYNHTEVYTYMYAPLHTEYRCVCVCECLYVEEHENDDKLYKNQ